MKYDTIIIGGGLAGLTAGATLSKSGKKVLLLERHHKPGGCATTFKRGDFIVEVGLHEFSGIMENGTVPLILDILGISEEVDFQQIPEFYGIYSDRSQFVVPHGYDNLIKALSDKYPEDAKAFRRFAKLVDGIRKEGVRLPASPLKLKLIYPLMPLMFPSLVEASKHTLGSWLDKHITNENAKLDLLGHISWWSDDPYKLSMFYFGLVFSGYMENGAHFIKGGSQTLSDALAGSMEKHGGTILLGKQAEKIITRNGKVTGVTLRDSFNKSLDPVTISCDNIVANLAPPLVPALLDEPHANALKQKISSYTRSISFFCIYLGFNTDVTKYGVKYYSNVIEAEGLKSLKDVYPNLKGDWSKRSFVLIDYGKVDAGLAPAGKSEGVVLAVDYIEDWENLNEEEYKAKKEEVAQMFLERIEKQFPGIRDAIEYYEVGTSKTIQKYTSNPGGSVFGYAPTKEQSGLNRLRDNFLIPNLYFASAWTFPGGGFEASIIAGFMVASKMNTDKIWSERDAEEYRDARIVKLTGRKENAGSSIELSFEKPKGFKHEKGQHAILTLMNPKVTKLDLPYRRLS
ncbi:MAG: NAD(P)/FAD-dependent oxidoreductase, partial [Bacteroidetes bacterium]